MIEPMAEEEPRGEATFETAFSNLLAAYEAAAGAVAEKGFPDGERAFKAATKLADALGHLTERAAKLRASTAARIADDEKLSLAALAGRLSVSKARAAQFVRNAKENTQGNTQILSEEGSNDG
jgi:hypothetical protein